MRILVLGAGGFIGRHIVSELQSAGHDVIGVARTTDALCEAFPDASFVRMDLTRAVTPGDWDSKLVGVEAIVNSAGVLRGREMDDIHVAMPKALYESAQKQGVKRVVLISAISARPEVATDYAQSKLEGEEALRATQLDWTILRPSLIYGDGSYGGTSLMRGMAGLPLVTPIPGDGSFAFTPLHVRDLAHAVRLSCEGLVSPHSSLEPVGPETLTLRELLARYRAWLGFGKTRFLPVPMPVMRILGRAGDWLGDGPISTNSLEQMVAGNAGDSTVFADAIGFVPRSLDTVLRDRPAQVQDRWHARLFFLAPALQVVLLVMWLASAWLGLFHGASQTGRFLDALGLPDSWSTPVQLGSSALDLAIAAQLLFDRFVVRSAVVQLSVVAGYTVVIGYALPHLWLDPLGPLLKNLPILVAIAIYGVIGDKR